ncbi:hypothetical protein TCAL_00063 [Tigriopus californicus]|uniref:U4/U6 small nuclear ribonucleoprotein Prp31 n=1 Tax=Tigriopus californicus TaxID=6832 RepID=A0A553PHM3_TIGCA|nr:U4/U6 small nuclear ribonucleoprotein Prp31-like [Tigriopus californicus]TRY77157.1 hypothetical protein TCAL_00063 [Tigriopus californicus]|eukprot:TCALIF_00063-PA protein Name:"Similar to Prpf31 U4/U6 small nuclear ribonucleoprotein Prp31 (Mus musculus)" AED:0.05 eAED:0.05 QI:69/1/1/1/1/1/4/215/513
MSLADELLADLEEESYPEEDSETGPVLPGDEDSMEQGSSGALTAAQSRGFDASMSEDVGTKLTLKSIARLVSSHDYVDIMSHIKASQDRELTAHLFAGPVEANPEYQFIVRANDIAAKIDDEIGEIYKFAKDIYSKRFPELETLVGPPLDYLVTAKELQNNILKAKNVKYLEQILNPATIMVVSVTASTTQGKDLEESELKELDAACDMALQLSEAKASILAFVESCMTFIAPNLSVIVGASIAAKLMGAAGGLTPLSKMPSGYIALLGQQKKSLNGFSQRTTLPHTGFIFSSQLVQNVPPDVRRKVARVVADKCTLAARVDACHESAEGKIGHNFLLEIERKIDKFLEPPPVKAIKALPTPIEAPKKKRGGRRVRNQKERYAVTELRKQANRMNFGELEEDVYQDDLGYSRGNIGKGSVGAGLRMAQIDERTKVRISQTLKRNLQKQQATWGGTTSIKKQISGTASSVAFTPLQGLEIVNPSAAENKDDSNQKYFSTSAAFVKVQTPAPKTT